MNRECKRRAFVLEIIEGHAYLGGKEQVILRDVNFFVFALSLSPVVSGLWFQILFYTVSSPVQNLQTYFTEEIAFSQNVLINQ